MPSTNANLETLIALMDGRTATTNTLLASIIEKQDTTITALNGISDRIIEVRELANSILFQVTLIQEWSLRGLLEEQYANVYEVLGLIDNNLGQLKTGWANFGWPMLENIYYATLDGSVSSFANTDCFDCDRPALLPVPGAIPPTDENLHCQRVQYYITTIRNTLDEFIDRFTAGINLTTQAAQILLLSGVIPGIDVATIPLGLITAMVSFGGTLWKVYLDTILDALTSHYDELVLALYEANSSAEATTVWNAWVDEFIPLIPNVVANPLAKLWGSSLFMNTLYDQAGYEWPGATGYDEELCGITPETFTTFTSIDALLATAPGGLAHQVEDPRPWIDLVFACETSLFGPTGWAPKTDTFVEGGDMNVLPKVNGFCDGDFFVRRIRKHAIAQTIAFYDPSSPVIEITTDWLELDTDVGDNMRLVSEIGGSEFQIDVQRFHMGIWQALF